MGCSETIIDFNHRKKSININFIFEVPPWVRFYFEVIRVEMRVFLCF